MTTVRNESTVATCPLHIWKHEVIVAAIAKGADGEVCREYNDKLVMWYQAGEPVWMAADSLAFIATESRKMIRAERASNFLAACVRAGNQYRKA